MTIYESIIEFRKYLIVTRAKGTQDYYNFYLNILDKEIGSLPTNEITKSNILNLLMSLKQSHPRMTNATLNKTITTLKTLIKYTTDTRINFQRLRESQKLIIPISQDTIERIETYYINNQGQECSLRNYLFIKLMLDTGLRVTEMINLKIADIDLNNCCIYVKITKTKRERYVCFTESTSHLLYKYIIANKPTNYLFYDPITKSQLTRSGVESFLYRLKKKLSISENITPHKWRHTFATKYLKKGGDLETLRLLLGHTNLKTTQKYLHLNKSDIINNYQSIMRQTDKLT